MKDHHMPDQTAQDPAIKTFAVTGTELRSHEVEYLVEAEDAAEALDKALEGSTIGERETKPVGEVVDRQFDPSGVSELAEVPVSEGDKAALAGRLQAAVGIAVSGIELLERVIAATQVESKPGTLRVTTETGTFLLTVRLEDFVTDPEIDD
jgi:hypothetical protein